MLPPRGTGHQAPFPCWAAHARRYRSRTEALGPDGGDRNSCLRRPSPPPPGGRPLPASHSRRTVPAPEEAAPAERMWALGAGAVLALALACAGVLAVWGYMALALAAARRRRAGPTSRFGGAACGRWAGGGRATAFPHRLRVRRSLPPVCTFPPGRRGKTLRWGNCTPRAGPHQAGAPTGILGRVTFLLALGWRPELVQSHAVGCPGYCWAGIWRWRAMRRCSAAPAGQPAGVLRRPCWPWPRPTGAPCCPPALRRGRG